MSNCLTCGRPPGEHSHDTRDICNMFMGDEPASDYSAWLIEIDWGNGPVYHQFQMDDDWTKDHDSACHFARERDAQQVIEYYGWTRAKAVEHMWPTRSARMTIEPGVK